MNNDENIVIVHKDNYCVFNIYAHFIEAKIERIIWIAFYKNNDNDQCLIKRLPIDLILYILFLLGKQAMKHPYIKIIV